MARRTIHGKVRGGKNRGTRIFRSSGTVFAAINLPHPEQTILKARLTLQISQIIKARGLTQTEAGEILRIRQPHVSSLLRNRPGQFSVGRLFEFLTALAHNVEITVRATHKAHGRISVVVA